MPANLTPQYLAAEKRYKEATTPPEKIEALEEMMAVMPKHKGTEKLQADLKHRLAKLRVESEHKHGPAKGSTLYVVHKEGCARTIHSHPAAALVQREETGGRFDGPAPYVDSTRRASAAPPPAP